MTVAAPSLFLRSPQTIYVYDAVASVVMGTVLVAGASFVAGLVGWPDAAAFLLPIGAFLLAWALFNYAIGSAGAPARNAVNINITIDGAWVALSAILLIVYWQQLNTLGHILLAGQMLFVATVFTIKLRGASDLRI